VSFLTDCVVRKIDEMGVADAASFFGVSELRVRQWQTGSKDISLPAVERVFELPALADLVQNEKANWQSKDLALLLPWYKSTNPLTAFCLLALFDRTRMATMLNFGDAFIIHSRNVLVRQFLESGFPWSLWIDDDMIVPWGNATWFNNVTGFGLPEKFAGMHAINRLRSHNKSLVGALYFGRHRGGKPMYCEGCTIAGEEAFARSGPHLTVKPTRWVATGCLLVHRSVYLDIQAKFPELAPRHPREPWNFFTPSEHDLVRHVSAAMNRLEDPHKSAEDKVQEALTLLEAGRKHSRAASYLGQGEDVCFCVRAAQAGHQPFVDLGLLCGHHGSIVYGAKSL
jgi:hypothetical protein